MTIDSEYFMFKHHLTCNVKKISPNVSILHTPLRQDISGGGMMREEAAKRRITEITHHIL